MSGFKPRTVHLDATRKFLLDFMPGERRKLRPTGIHIFRLRYWADWFCDEIADDRGVVDVRYDTRDISVIYVQDLSGAWQSVHLYHACAPFSLREHEATLKSLDEAARNTRDESTIHRARDDRRALVSSAERKTTRARRQVEEWERGYEVTQSVLRRENPPSPATIPLPKLNRSVDVVWGDDDVEVW